MQPPFELTYFKCKNSPGLFKTLEETQPGLKNMQNYMPFYNRFFLLSDSNHNSVRLNNKNCIYSISKVINKHQVMASFECHSDSKNTHRFKSTAFIKYSPLIDPIKYISGKYDMQASDLLKLPTFGLEPTSIHQKKINQINNSSYVDSFFTYLSSQLLHTHGFVHGLDFYGSYLANQKEFTVNIYDEIDFLNGCDFFLKNKDILFKVDNLPYASSVNSASNKPPLQLSNHNEVIPFDTEPDLSHSFNSVFHDPVDHRSYTVTLEPLDEFNPFTQETVHIHSNNKSDTDDSDSCSSRSSSSSNEPNEPNEPNERTPYYHEVCNQDYDSNESDRSDDDGSTTSSSAIHDEIHNAHIFNFPVNTIIMEKCDNTLDTLMYGKNELTENEWASILMQIIFILITYQHIFSFTHNDLHTNNVMFIKTDKKYLYYHHGGTYYRVPTHGRIIKIIDFGRAIYKFKGQTIVSDSFDRNGDAATQYNCDPYLNQKKPRLDPNPSFDLCRLACSLFDYFIDDIRDESNYNTTLKNNSVASLIVDWLKDDKGRNVLYKKNGVERYPEFKLYKMIARTVHNAIPHKQLKHPLFSQFVIQQKFINGKPLVMNIDSFPIYH